MLTAGIIPCYKSVLQAPNIVKRCLDYLDFVICIDDCCPVGTGDEIESKVQDKKLYVLRHKKNYALEGC